MRTPLGALLGALMIAPASILLVASASAAPPGRLAVVALDFTYPHASFRLTLYSTGGRAQTTLVRASASSPLTRVAAPAWSADGRLLYFTGSGPEHEGERFHYLDSDVYAVDPASRRVRRLTHTRDAANAVPAPDGSLVVFGRVEHPARRPFTSGMWLMRPDGTDARRLLPVRPGWHDIPGAWSPDGERLAFTRCPPVRYPPDGLFANRCAVYELELATRKLRKLADRAGSPAYSPDGRLAFVSDRDENGRFVTGSDENAYASELYVANADGSGARRLTDTPDLDEQSPTWSPDGAWIAYAREGPAIFVSQLMIVGADGAGATLVAGEAASSATPHRKVPSLDQPSWRQPG